MKLKKEDLHKIAAGKNFCILPWLHLHVLPDSTVIPCCISPYDDTYGNGTTQTVEEIWNSDKFKALRLKMLNDEPAPGCARCFKLEENGFTSARQIWNTRFAKHIPTVLDTKEDGTFQKVDFKYIDIRFSNLCNFKCRGCGPTLSSAWFEDHQALHNFSSDQTKIRSVAIGSPNFWDELKSLIPHAEMIYFGGGEPLITREHFEVLKLLLALGKTDIDLTYNTNLSTLNYGAVNLDEMWSKFKFVSLGISIDDIGPRAEYFRHGTKWEVIERNMKKIVENYTHVKVYINCTVNIMNVFYLPEIFEYLVSRNIIRPNGLNINLLLDPNELRIQVLPASLKAKVKRKLKEFRIELLTKGPEYFKPAADMENILNFLDEEDMSDQLPLFKKNTLKLDELRKEDFKAVFPELVELLD